MEVNSVDIVQFFGSTRPLFGAGSDNFRYSFTSNLNMAYFLLLALFMGGIFFWTQKQKSRSFMKNVRMPQLAYHAGLFGAGMGLGAYIYPENISVNPFSVLAAAVLLVSIWLAWEASVVVNDIYDFEVDKISNGGRPLQKKVFSLAEYADLGIILFCLSLLGGIVVGLKFAILIFVYQTVAWFYSAPPFRLKRFPVIATFFSAIASIVVVFIGFSLFSGQDNIKLFPWRMILLLLFGLTLSLPIKDFKDIDGDKACGILTVPVLFGMETGRIVVGSGIFISFMLSVFFLNESGLFWWAMLAGAASFWLVMNKKPRQLFWWVMAVTAVYALILVKIIFVP
jgi:4-hydroxybenzoate polyprenyltransferase